MKNLKIPYEYPDLQAYAHEQDTKFWRKFLLSVLGIALVEVLFLFEQVSGYVGWPLSAAICIAMVVIAFFACGGWGMITDRAFEGVVEKVSYDVCPNFNVLSTKRMVQGFMMTVRTWNSNGFFRCRMVVRDDRGRRIKYETLMVGDPDSYIITEGCRVRRFRRIPCPLVEACKDPVCVICGMVNKGDLDGTCSVCGHTLIK